LDDNRKVIPFLKENLVAMADNASNDAAAHLAVQAQ